MRLLNVETYRLEEFFPHEAVPAYAILSHTWERDNEEVSFRDVEEGKLEKEPRPIKLEGCCKQAREDGYSYTWIDTCCIDKTNSVELHEAINSMFQWYRDASICYAYLSDVPPNDNPRDPEPKFFSSRWFIRGWTLQELLAPASLRFFNSEWRCLGTKGEMCTVVERITGIPSAFLLGVAELHDASVAQRMSWAAKRVTKRREDIAYCLLGIFGVTMSMIYGEGNKAFRRLQEEIMKDIGDDSILAWGLNLTDPTSMPGGILATTPSDFASCGKIVSRERSTRASFDLFGGSLQLRLPLSKTSAGETFGLLRCGPEHDTNQVVGIPLIATSKESPNVCFRPQGCCSVLVRKTASEAPTQLIQLRNDHQSKTLAATNQRYWFFVPESLKPELELIDVEPLPYWHKERALIATTIESDGDTTGRALARFRHKNEGARDFVLVLEFETQFTSPMPCHDIL